MEKQIKLANQKFLLKFNALTFDDNNNKDHTKSCLRQMNDASRYGHEIDAKMS